MVETTQLCICEENNSCKLYTLRVTMGCRPGGLGLVSLSPYLSHEPRS